METIIEVVNRMQASVLNITTCYIASFPGRFGREKRPGNFREFKLFTDVTSRQLHTSFNQ